MIEPWQDEKRDPPSDPLSSFAAIRDPIALRFVIDVEQVTRPRGWPGHLDVQ
jgi:hypothetical protein